MQVRGVGSAPLDERRRRAPAGGMHCMHTQFNKLLLPAWPGLRADIPPALPRRAEGGAACGAAAGTGGPGS